MNSLDTENTTSSEFFKVEKFVEEITALRKENISLKMDLQHLKLQVIQARKFAELDSKYCNGLRNYFKGRAK